MTRKKFTVAIDGPAAAGKGTIAREIAARFGFAHLDTGLLYRAVGRKVLERTGGRIDPQLAGEVARHLTKEDVARDDLRTSGVGQAASQVAAFGPVRAALLDFQREFAARDGGAVLDGRDIGTVVCPDADVKLFVTASDTVRAARRFAELLQKGEDVTQNGVLADLKARDARDAGRDTAPMIVADDAVLLDTSELAIDAAVAMAATIITRKYGQGRD
jgi:CMP/dCMP kinase